MNLPEGNVGETPLSEQSFNRMSHLFHSQDEIVYKSKPYQSYFNSTKIFLGNAYLTIPNVFKRTGWIGGIILFSVIALLNCISMSMVMKAAQKKSTLTNKISSFSALAAKTTGRTGKVISDLSVFLV